MNISIRAVVEDGKLRPIDPIDLVEGQEVEMTIYTEIDAAAAIDNQLSLFASDDQG